MEPYNPSNLTPAGMQRAVDPDERIRAARAVVLLEQSLSRVGVRAVAFLPIHQPEREEGQPVWRLTALAGQLKYGLTVDEATLSDPDALDAFVRQHTTDQKGAHHMAA
jgi:hypothetical protein